MTTQDRTTTTTAAGVATFENLPPGRYTITAEFQGFETVIIKDYRVRAGENKRSVTLPIKKVAEDVVVGGCELGMLLEPVVCAEILDARPVAEVVAHGFRETHDDGFAAHAVEIESLHHVVRDVFDALHRETGRGERRDQQAGPAGGPGS